MSATMIDGVALATRHRASVREEVMRLRETRGVTPGLAVVLVGDDPASGVYVRNKVRLTRECGMESFEFRMTASSEESEIVTLVERLNADPNVHGVLVQLPLPPHVDSRRVIEAVSPQKDVDGFHPLNVGHLYSGTPLFVPCTPLGCLALIRSVRTDLTGLHAVVVGRSQIVGQPVGQLLTQANCTVTLAHSRTRSLADVCRSADIVVAAVGRPALIRGDWIKEGAIVIDVGINRVTDSHGTSRLTGDVDFAGASERAAAITPVPGGVGPMTIAYLLSNTVAAARSARINAPEESPGK